MIPTGRSHTPGGGALNRWAELVRAAGRLFREKGYEAVWQAVLTDLKDSALLRDDGQLTRLFLLGALKRVAQWYRPGGEPNLDEIADAAVALFLP